MAVRIRMKKMGRKHRPYYRICAMDARQPRDGRVLEELGSYDPMVANTDSRVKLAAARIKYWISVGAQPTEKVQVLLKKYLAKWEQAEAEAQAAALPINALVARIDAERIVAQHPPGLAGAIRLWLAARAVARLKDAGLNEPQQPGSAAVHPSMGTKPTSGR